VGVAGIWTPDTWRYLPKSRLCHGNSFIGDIPITFNSEARDVGQNTFEAQYNILE